MPDERPAFTVGAEGAARPALPVGAWAVATFAAAALTGALAQASVCSPYALCTGRPFENIVPLSLGAFCGALAWVLLPIARGREASLRAAALLAIAAGLAVEAVPYGRLQSPWPWYAFAVLGAASPTMMLPALRPDAALILAGEFGRKPKEWLIMGAVPASAIFLGAGSGILLPGLALLWPALLAVAGVLILHGGRIPHGPDLSTERPPENRARMFLRMSPMLRHAFLAEAGIAFAFASCVAAVAIAGWPASHWPQAGAATALGGTLGAAVYALAAPRIEGALGRGRLLTLSVLAAALAPLALAAAFATFDGVKVLIAAALAAFALSSAPQRYAILFDLATPRGRLRTSFDLHAVKLAAAAFAPFSVVAVERAAPGLGLVAASAVSLACLAFFAPTLGTLGRRTR